MKRGCNLELFILEKIRLRGDVINVCKLLREVMKSREPSFFQGCSLARQEAMCKYVNT